MLNTYRSRSTDASQAGRGRQLVQRRRTAALTQAEAEYRTSSLLSQRAEAAEAQMKVATSTTSRWRSPTATTTTRSAPSRNTGDDQHVPDSTLVPRPSRSCATCRRFWPSARPRSGCSTGAVRIQRGDRAPGDGCRHYPLYSKSDQALLASRCLCRPIEEHPGSKLAVQ